MADVPIGLVVDHVKLVLQELAPVAIVHEEGETERDPVGGTTQADPFHIFEAS